MSILIEFVQGIFEIPITYINNKYGLFAAWICTIAMVSLTIVLMYVLVSSSL